MSTFCPARLWLSKNKPPETGRSRKLAELLATRLVAGQQIRALAGRLVPFSPGDHRCSHPLSHGERGHEGDDHHDEQKEDQQLSDG